MTERRGTRMNYKTPSWANWKKLTDAQLAQANVSAAEVEIEELIRENTEILKEHNRLRRECIQTAERIWGVGSKEVAYLTRARMEFPPNLRRLLNKYKRAVSDAKGKLEKRAKGREAYHRRKETVQRVKEIDQYILERYGAGWEEQE